MKIVNHLLCLENGAPCAFAQSPNHGRAITPRYLVIHFTASHSAKVAIDWLINPEARASAHVVLARDGNYLQRIS